MSLSISQIKDKMHMFLSMIKPPPGNIIGIDISDCHIKIMVMHQDDGMTTYSASHCYIYNLPSGVMSNGRIENTSTLAAHIKKAVTQAGATEIKQVCIGLRGAHSIVRTLAMPVQSEFDLVKQIGYEINDSLPYNIEDVYLDFQVLGPTTDDHDSMDVMIVACKKDIAHAYIDVLNHAGLELACLDCASFAIGNAAMTLMAPVESSASAVVEIGKTNLSIIVIKDNETIYSKSISFGVDALIMHLEAHYEIDHDGAVESIIKFPLDIDICSNFFVDLDAEIVRLNDFYIAAGFIDSPIVKIFLCGGGAMISGVSEYLSAGLTGIDFERVSSEVIIAGSPEMQSFIDANIPLLFLAMGLSMRGKK